MLQQFIKFSVVGFSGLLVDFGVTYLLKEVARVNKYIANSVGFICAATSNYILNRIWTFQSNDPEITRQYFTFIIIAVVGLAINNAVVYLLNDRVKWNFYLSKLIATGMVTLWNFFMNYYITFNVISG